MVDATIGLAEAIAGLREQLLEAMDEGVGSPMRFRLTQLSCRCRLRFPRRGMGGSVGRCFGRGCYSSATAQTLVLRLEPLWQQDDGSYTADFTIAAGGDAGLGRGVREPLTR